MAPSVLHDACRARLREVVAGALGLHFPRERWADLERGLAGAAEEFGIEDLARCAEWLLSSPLSQAQVRVLASHLTIGETYFFRDRQMLGALTERILPGLIGTRRGGTQRLRLWSAACCSGEEPYTLAMLLHQLLPDLSDWQVTIVATDVNPRFLHKAATGLYGEWSFRDAPAALKARYFTRAADGRYAVNPEIRRMVSFAPLNLVGDAYPSSPTDTDAMDLVCCRNVLMYFTPAQVARVVGKLRHALVDGGWLVVSPSEASHDLFSGFATVSFPGAILYQKSAAPSSPGPALAPPLDCMAGAVCAADAVPLPWARLAADAEPTAAPAPPERDPVAAAPGPCEVAASLRDRSRHAEAADTLLASLAGQTPDASACSLLARALADQGRLAEALEWCERWTACDKVDPAGHYLRAAVLLELGDREQARASLRRVLYLHPHFVLAHFALGNLARRDGNGAEARRHFANALCASRRHPPDALLSESDGLTAARMIEIIDAMGALEAGS